MLQQFLSFDKLIGTKLIKILYFVGLIGIVLGGLGAIFAAFGAMRYSFGGGVGALLGALIATAAGLLFWRFICELYLLFFRMSDDLRDIKNHQMGLEANKTDVNIGD